MMVQRMTFPMAGVIGALAAFGAAEAARAQSSPEATWNAETVTHFATQGHPCRGVIPKTFRERIRP